jgi:transcriptional regulator with XRE-family HTH domain
VNESAERLTELVKRARGKLSQRKFAEELGISWTTVYAWEKGKRFPDRENLLKIATRAGCSFDAAIAYLNEGEVPQPVEIDKILTSIKFMQPKDLALVGHAIADRLIEAI